MSLNQMQYTVAGLSAISLLLHLSSAGNFDATTQSWFMINMFGHLHSLCNVAARLGLFVTALTAATEHCFPGMVTACTGVESQYFSLYWYKLLTASFLTTVIRFLLPGPCLPFSRFYTFGLVATLAAALLSAIDANSTNFLGKSLLQRKMAFKKSNKHDDERRESRSRYQN